MPVFEVRDQSCGVMTTDAFRFLELLERNLKKGHQCPSPPPPPSQHNAVQEDAQVTDPCLSIREFKQG